jgi:hypothetical protein
MHNRIALAAVATTLTLSLTACAKSESAPSFSRQSARSDSAPAVMASPAAPPMPGGGGRPMAEMAAKTTTASLPTSGTAAADDTAARAPAAQMERKIIRNAQLTLEAPKPEDIRAKVQVLAESRGGFVLSSDTTTYGGASTVKIVVRVPASQFPGVLEALHGVGARVAQENVTGQDVTDEYYDLEARLRSQRAIEAQYLEILKRAVTIKDTLDVQQKLGEIRTEIERAEGRRRLLENQASLSTLTITITREAPPSIVEEKGFFAGVKRDVSHAVRDAGEVAVGIVSGGIRLLGVLVPVVLMIFLPFGLLVRWFWRRGAKRRQAEREAYDARMAAYARGGVPVTPSSNLSNKPTTSDAPTAEPDATPTEG